MVNTGVIDADGHVRDDDKWISKYIEAPYDERPRHVSGARDGFDNTRGGRLGTRVVDVNTWLDALDRGGIDTTVLYPTGSLGLGWLAEPDYAVARARAYNNFLSEEYMKVNPRFKGVAVLPAQDPDEAVKELRRCVNELGMVGGLLGEGPRLFGKPEYHPIWAEAERLGTMIAIHGSGRMTGTMDEWLFERFVQVHSLGHAFTQMKQFVSIIFDGVPELFPNVRIAFLEAGCGWAVYMLDRMDERYGMRGDVDSPLMVKPPSEYVADGNIYVSLEADERLLPETMRILGDDKFVYASDFPHWDGEFPGNIKHLLSREDLTQEQRTKITSLNAKRLYGLE
jgi:predicted TIM-barrel fold metal-dependent hydrolase